MTKKKAAIYGSIMSVFAVLLFVYIWTVLQSASRINMQHLHDGVALSETQINKNIEHHIRFVTMELAKYDAGKATPLEKLLDIADIVEEQVGGGAIYIIGNDGIMHKNNGKMDGRRLDSFIIKTARSSGYAALSILSATNNGNQDIALIMPLSGELPYCFVQMISVENFIKLIVSNIAVPASYIALFDEWGNKIGQMMPNPQIHADTIKSVAEGAVGYKSDNKDNVVQKQKFLQHYNAYIKLNQPKGWFLGTYVDYSQFNPISSGIISSSAAIFALLILIFVVVIVLDVINDAEKKKELFLVSNIDQLTGLVNNAGLQETVNSFMQKNNINGFSFVAMDIVAFSRINSMFGYSVGDMLLRIISGVIRERYYCGARTNADCFCFLTNSSENMAALLEERFFKAIEVHMGKKYIQMIAFKFGIYPITDVKTTFREMHDGALLALKDAKKQSKQAEVIYDAHLKSSVEFQKKVEMNMMHALSKEEFVIYIQPQLELPTGKCSRGESLIRWNSEIMGLMPPDKFIPIFESNGFIVEIDFFMLTSVLQYLQDRYDAGQEVVTLAVNQSKVTISFPNYLERIKSIVEQFTVPLKYIELEITESTIENELERIVPLVHHLKRMGFTIAMDDFGSGFSSLNTLRVLPIDILKIDKEFLQESDTSERTKKIISNIINMAKELKITVICEGVERQDQLDFLKKVGCDIAQGYFFSKPIPLQEFIDKYIDMSEGTRSGNSDDNTSLNIGADK